jgi:hypothetical protein
MESPIQENPWPVWKLITMTWALGLAGVIGVMSYERLSGRLQAILPLPTLIVEMTAAFAILLLAILLRIRPQGKWTRLDDGLRFVSNSGKTQYIIPWQSISRTNNTSASVVISWFDEETDAKRKSVLLMGKTDGAALIEMIKGQTHSIHNS